MHYGRMLRARGLGMTLAAVAALAGPVAAANASTVTARHAGTRAVHARVAVIHHGFKRGGMYANYVGGKDGLKVGGQLGGDAISGLKVGSLNNAMHADVVAAQGFKYGG